MSKENNFFVCILLIINKGLDFGFLDFIFLYLYCLVYINKIEVVVQIFSWKELESLYI